MAGGDQLATTITAGSNTRATIASQAAERLYRALPGQQSRIATTLHVAEQAALEWLPQETILFDRCAFHRTLAIHLTPTSWFLGVESLVFGRTAMAEQVHTASIHDRITLHLDGRLLLHDTFRLEGAVAERLNRAAIARGARAIATILHTGPDAAQRLEPLRAALAPFDAGASLIETLLIARITAPTGAHLRHAVATGLNSLRADRTLPRVWLC